MDILDFDISWYGFNRVHQGPDRRLGPQPEPV